MTELQKQVWHDCGRFCRLTTLFQLLWEFSTIAAPTVAAWLIGDMTDSLLALDAAAIAAALPPFLLAMAVTIFLPSLLLLAVDDLHVDRGYAYDAFLIDKFIRKALIDVQSIEAGKVMERLVADTTTLRFLYVYAYGRPILVLCYAGVLAWAMVFRGYHPLFCLGLVVLSCLPVIKAAALGKKKAVIEREMNEYSEERRTVEQELHPSRDFLWSFGLEPFTQARFLELYKNYVNRSGRKMAAFRSTDAVLTFLCDYGVQALIILWGGILVSLGLLSLGALVGGFLMLPWVTKCGQLLAECVEEVRGRKEYIDRLAVFYGDRDTDEAVASPAPGAIRAEGLTFTYPGREAPVLEDVSLTLTRDTSLRLPGPNGSGKTTLLTLLTGLYVPQAGRITDGGGQPIPRGRLRTFFAVQEQSGAIFSGTVEENLFLSPGQREEAEALLTEFRFEKPIDYPTEPEGANLSPGERKKLTLIRALLRDAPFLALDEPLNHLDDRGRCALAARLAQRQGGLLLISHREVPGAAAEPVELKPEA